MTNLLSQEAENIIFSTKAQHTREMSNVMNPNFILWNLQNFEKKFMYSQIYLTIEFKEEFGVTPYQYIKKLRLDASRHMMINTTKSIEQIAFDCGYTNFTTF